MKTYKVRMMAFGKPGEIREVDVPDGELGANPSTLDVLSMIWEYGQNDFQPKQHPSVSCGDVIDLNDDHYLVCGVGFRRITPTELAEHQARERVDRSIFAMQSCGVDVSLEV